MIRRARSGFGSHGHPLSHASRLPPHASRPTSFNLFSTCFERLLSPCLPALPSPSPSPSSSSRYGVVTLLLIIMMSNSATGTIGCLRSPTPFSRRTKAALATKRKQPKHRRVLVRARSRYCKNNKQISHARCPCLAAATHDR